MILRVFHPLSPPMQMHREEAEDIPASNPAPESKENTPAAAEEDIPDIDELELEDAEVDEVGLLLPGLTPPVHDVPAILLQ